MRIKLTEFRIQNYRCIDDSGWIKVEDITALVGVNESGKTAILNALCTLNPGSGELNIDYIRDFPRNRLSSEYSEDCFLAEGHFTIPKEYLYEKNLIKKFNLKSEKDLILLLTRKYDKVLNFHFEAELEKKCITPLKKKLQETRKRINRKEIIKVPLKSDKEELNNEKSQKENNNLESQNNYFFTKEIQELIIIIIDNFIKKIEELYDSDTIFRNTKEREEFSTIIDDNNRALGKYFNFAEDELKPLLDYLEDIISEMKEKSKQSLLFEEIKPDIPIFIYFEDYSILEGSIVISDLVKAIRGDLKFKEFKIQETLFKHVNLDPEEIYELGSTKLTPEQNQELNKRIQMKNISAEEVTREFYEKISQEKQKELKKRKILLDSASQLMTETLNKYFQERNYKVEYDTDGQFLQILVWDEKKPSKMSLEERSKGFRWYFSFFIVFLVESKRTLKNAILLLDEPGIHLHLQAQFNLINFFQNLKDTNQIIYTTHSPFLIDEYHLEQVRSVFEDENGITKVTENNLIPDEKAIFPLQAALRYRTSQVIYQGLKQLLVEGDTDFNYIKTINSILLKLNKTTLDKDLVIVPCKSASKIEMYARLFIDLENIPVVLLDSDESGQKAYEILTESLFMENKKNILLLGQFLKRKEKCEIEDLIGKELLVKCLNRNNLVSPLVSESEIEDGAFNDSLIKYCSKNEIKLVPNWKYKLSIKFKKDFLKKDKESILKEILEEKIDIFENLIQKINQYAKKKVND